MKILKAALAATLVAGGAFGATLVGTVIATPAAAAEPIVGKWRRNNGTLIRFSGSGSNYCGTVLSGKYKGRSIGCMKGKGASYRGTINVLDEGKKYTGKARVTGNSMKLSGCVLGGLVCKGETLRRQ